jgi:hypothetical protein
LVAHYTRTVFEACLHLPKTPKEADLIAENLDALAIALRDWPVEAWQRVEPPDPDPSAEAPHVGLFERLIARTAPTALDPRQRTRAMQSAQAVAGVLRVMWPETRPVAHAELALAA